MTPPTLVGLTVNDWLETNAESRPAVVAPASAAPSRRTSTGAWPWWLLGTCLGTYLAIAHHHADLNCPPAGEGRLYCQVQHGILPAVTIVLVTAVVVAALGTRLSRRS